MRENRSQNAEDGEAKKEFEGAGQEAHVIGEYTGLGESG